MTHPPTGFAPPLSHETIRGQAVIVWRGHGLEHAFRGDPSQDPKRWKAFLHEVWTAGEHHAAGRPHLNAHLHTRRHLGNTKRKPLDHALVTAKIIEAGGAPPDA